MTKELNKFLLLNEDDVADVADDDVDADVADADAVADVADDDADM